MLAITQTSGILCTVKGRYGCRRRQKITPDNGGSNGKNSKKQDSGKILENAGNRNT